MRKLVFIILLMFCLNVNVYATEISGNGSAKNYGNTGGGSGCSDTSIGFGLASGLRVTIVRSDGTLISSSDFYSSQSANIPTKSNGNNCSKIEYLKGTCTSRTNKLYKVSFKSFMDNDSNKGGKTSEGAIKYIFDYLEGSNYYNLKELVKLTGYNCINNVGTGICSASIMNDSYIIVEPMAKFGTKFGTAYELSKMTDYFKDSNYCYLSPKWGRFASFTVPDGTYMGINFSDKVSSYTTNKYLNAIKDNASSNGVMIYSMADIVDIPVEPDKGKIVIEKQNSSGQPASAKFGIFSNSNCSGLIEEVNVVSGTGKSSKLEYGTYYVKEIEAPSGYVLSNECRVVTLDQEEKKLDQPFINKTYCENEFDLSDKSMATRISLYQKYNFRNLLNLSEVEGKYACQTVSCNTDSVTTCLSGHVSGDSSFSANNLSCYNDELRIGNTLAGYCLTTFNFDNNLTTNSFTSISGQLLNELNISSIAATGTINKKCYIFNNISGDIMNNSYSDYVQKITFNLSVSPEQEELKPIIDDDELILKNSNGNWREYELNVNYKFNPIYSKIGTGEKVNEGCSNCRFLGYGLISQLSDIGINYIDFEIILNDPLKINPIKEADKCVYTATPKLVNVEDLLLEFRTIKSSNAFPGKDGDGRIVGSNWCNGSDCNSSNDLISNIMNNRNDSYNKLNSQPLYRIVLTPDTIKNIREEYNKNNTYDDYTLECDANNKCKSTFLEHYGFTRTIEEIQWLEDYEEIIPSNVDSTNDSITEGFYYVSEEDRNFSDNIEFRLNVDKYYYIYEISERYGETGDVQQYKQEMEASIEEHKEDFNKLFKYLYDNYDDVYVRVSGPGNPYYIEATPTNSTNTEFVFKIVEYV